MLKKFLFAISAVAFATMFVACGSDSESTKPKEDSKDICTEDPGAPECQTPEEPAPDEEV